MARNEEKHYGRLNRLILLKEKEEYEKSHPKRPRLDLLDTPEEIQKWLPSIKRDIDFYLKKSQVTCYSDEHVEECKLKVNKLEKEFKAFVRKISQLTPGGLEVTPWTSRPYKRKNADPIEVNVRKEFLPIATPILDKEKNSISTSAPVPVVHLPLMDKPLSFKKRESMKSAFMDFENLDFNSKSEFCGQFKRHIEDTSDNSNKSSDFNKRNCEKQINIVSYNDSSDAEDSS